MRLLFSVSELSRLTGLAPRTIQIKAKNHSWPTIKKPAGKGRPKHLYDLSIMPDNIQLQWSSRTGLIEASTALGWPIRESYFLPNKAMWDGESQGLCLEAQQTLLKRFPDLADIEPGSLELEPIRATIDPEDAKQEKIEQLKSQIADLGQTGTEEEQQVNDELISVRYFEDVSAAAGSGFVNTDHQQSVMMQMTPGMLEMLAPGLPTKGLTMIKAHGDSMEPDIYSGDKLLLTSTDGTVKEGAVYIVRVRDTIMVKRVYKHPMDKSIELVSSNPRHKPIIITGPDTDDVAILGQVVGRLRIDQL